MPHIYIGGLVIIGSGNGSSPVQCQAITWNNADFLLIDESHNMGVLLETWLEQTAQGVMCFWT